MVRGAIAPEVCNQSASERYEIVPDVLSLLHNSTTLKAPMHADYTAQFLAVKHKSPRRTLFFAVILPRACIMRTLSDGGVRETPGRRDVAPMAAMKAFA